jgi:predicted nucleic acid-binding Zn ribbon protein
MQKKNAQPLSEVLSDFFDSNSPLKKKLAEHRAVKGWYELLGEGVAKYTRNAYFSRGVLYVQLSSSVLRAELLMNKQGLVEKINEYAGMNVIRDIVLR